MLNKQHVRMKLKCADWAFLKLFFISVFLCLCHGQLKQNGIKLTGTSDGLEFQLLCSHAKKWTLAQMFHSIFFFTIFHKQISRVCCFSKCLCSSERLEDAHENNNVINLSASRNVQWRDGRLKQTLSNKRWHDDTGLNNHMIRLLLKPLNNSPYIGMIKCMIQKYKEQYFWRIWK